MDNVAAVSVGNGHIMIITEKASCLIRMSCYAFILLGGIVMKRSLIGIILVFILIISTASCIYDEAEHSPAGPEMQPSDATPDATTNKDEEAADAIAPRTAPNEALMRGGVFSAPPDATQTPAAVEMMRPSTDASMRTKATPYDATLLSAYRAYHGFLSAMVEEHGFGRYERISNEWWIAETERSADSGWTEIVTGVAYAELLDFDNDGIPELLIINIRSLGLGCADDRTAYIVGYSGRAEVYHTVMVGGGEGGGRFFELVSCEKVLGS
jgi:hypothetical protein